MHKDNYVVLIGDSIDPLLVGGKGASLSIMAALKLPVPPGITITTDAWRAWKDGVLTIPMLFRRRVRPALDKMCPNLGKGQMVSVRSGAAQSMPGMMETVLNVGASLSRDKLAYIFSWIKAAGLDSSLAESIIDKHLLANKTFLLDKLSPTGRKVLASELLAYIGQARASVYRQIMLAIQLVFESWDSEKARSYRSAKGIPDDGGTACTIQLMVNGLDGLSGVMLTRGSEDGAQIDWIDGAQGDSVVDGSAKPNSAARLAIAYPKIYDELFKASGKIEEYYHDAMDIEFTVDGSRLYLLQCRPMKRTQADAMRIAVQLYEAGLVSTKKVLDVPLVDDSVERVIVDQERLIATGAPVNGKLLRGRLRILQTPIVKPDDITLRKITTTSDIDLMKKCAAVITIVGGPACHAALVARELGTTSIVGVGGEIYKRSCGKTGKPLEEHIMTWKIGNDTILDGAHITLTPDGKVIRGWSKVKPTIIPGVWSKKLSDLQKTILTSKTPD
jgi:pyruvate,orthophosphate dikinase